MSEKIVQLNEEVIKGQIKELVRGSVEEKAECIKMIFNLFLVGCSLRQIKEALERRNILTPQGNTE